MRKKLTIFVGLCLMIAAMMAFTACGSSSDTAAEDQDTTAVEAEAADSGADAEATEAEGFSYDSDNPKFMAMCNTILDKVKDGYDYTNIDAAIPVPCVVYEEDVSEETDRLAEWGTFAVFNFHYNPDELLMELESCGYDGGVIFLEGVGGEFIGEWEQAMTDADQKALEEKYGVTDKLKGKNVSTKKVDKKMKKILKGYCEYNGFKCEGYKDIDGTVYKFK